jgi:hypothetical protein
VIPLISRARKLGPLGELLTAQAGELSLAPQEPSERQALCSPWKTRVQVFPFAFGEQSYFARCLAIWTHRAYTGSRQAFQRGRQILGQARNLLPEREISGITLHR